MSALFRSIRHRMRRPTWGIEVYWYVASLPGPRLPFRVQVWRVNQLGP